MTTAPLRLRLQTALLRFGTANLQRVWGVDESVVSRRLNSERGVTIAELVAVLEAMGATLCLPGDGTIVVKESMYDSLLNLAHEATEQLREIRMREKGLKAEDESHA